MATLPRNAAVYAGKAVATLKIIPYALPRTIVDQVEEVSDGNPIIYLTPFAPKRVGLILSGSPAAKERVTTSFRPPLAARLELLHSTIERVDYLPLEDESGER